MQKRMMKKAVVLLAVLCMLFVFTACGKTVELTLGETTTVEKHVEFTPENVIISSQVFPPISGTDPMGWVVDDEDKTYVTVIASIKNLGSEAMTTDDLWVDFFVILNEEYVDGTIVAVTTENDTKLNDNASIEPNQTETVYFITEVAKNELDKLTRVEFDFSGSTLSLTVDTTKSVARYESLTMKETYKVKHLGNVIPQKMSFMSELEPSNPGYTYDYYVPQTDNDKMLVLTTKTENTSKSKKAAYRYLNMLVFAGGDEYLGDVVADDAYSANITGSEKLGAGDERNVYALVNLPKSVKKADCEIYIYIDGMYYQYQMK